MRPSLSVEDLSMFITKQVSIFFPDEEDFSKINLVKQTDEAIQRAEYCFSKINLKYFTINGEVLFNHLHSDQYSMFLYFLSNTLFNNSIGHNLCNKLYMLNKALNGIDVFYEVKLPEIFLFAHPVGTVLGRGEYSDYFLVYQRCNIGSNKDIYPTMGKHVSVHPGASIIGNCTIGDVTALAAHSLLLDKDLKNNSLYIGNPKSHNIKELSQPKNFWL
jgi:serine O-acetyltransferase